MGIGVGVLEKFGNGCSCDVFWMFGYFGIWCFVIANIQYLLLLSSVTVI